MDDGCRPASLRREPVTGLAQLVVSGLATLLQAPPHRLGAAIDRIIAQLGQATGAECGWIRRDGAPGPLHAWGAYPDPLPPDCAPREGFGDTVETGPCLIRLSLNHEGREIGQLCLGGQAGALALTDADLALLAGLADGLAGALAPHRAASDTEERLRATLAAMPELLLEIDLDGRCIDLHCSAPELLAGSVEHTVGRLIEDTIPTEVARLQRAGMARALRHGSAQLRPYRIRHGERDVWYHTTIARRMGPDGCTGFVFRIRDATLDHERAAEIAMLGEVTRSMPNHALVLDAETRIIWANHSVEAMAGRPLSALKGIPIGELADPGIDPDTLAAINAALTQHRALRIDVAKTDRSGARIWVDVAIQPLTDENGAPSGFTIIETDITEIKRHEAALRQMAQAAEQARARLFAAIEALPDGFLYFDADDRLVLCNTRIREFFPKTGHKIVPGVRFESFLREALEAGEFPEACDDKEAWIAERLAARRLPEHTSEFTLAGGRVIRSHERQTPEGGRVGLRIDISESRNAEARLKEVVDAARLGIWEFDCRTVTTRYNGAWLAILGSHRRDLGDLTPEVWADLVHPADRPHLAELTRAMRRGDRDTIEGEFRLRHTDGHWVHILVRGKISQVDADGTPLLVSGIGIDITERRQTESRLRAILEASSVGTWQLDCEQGSVVIDEQYAAMLGYRLDELLPWTHERFESMVHPDDIDALRNRVSDLYGTDTASTAHEFRIRHRDGHYVWIMSQARVQRWSAPGVAAEESGLHIDITERKEREFALAAAKQALEEALAAQRASEQRYADIVAISDEWFWEVAPDHVLRHLTSGFARTTGIAVDAIIGRRLSDLVKAAGDSDLERDWATLIARVGRREPLNDFLVKLPALGGAGPIWLRISGAPYFTADGQYAGYRGAGSNVSALIAATQRAEAASEAKSRFLANMSHELRTPLTGVLGMADLLADTPVDSQQRAMIDTIRTSGEGLLAILNDILDLAKIEAGKMSVESHPFRPDEVVDRVQSLFAPRAATSGLALVVQSGAGLGETRLGDANRLLQILTNLVGNAIKFTQQGAVTLRAELVAGPSPMLQIEVEDTGIGMSEDQLARVFDEFEQAETSTARRFGGTGLGLSITRRLVTLIGGTITIRSREGTGTCVSLAIPCPRAPQAAAPQVAHPIHAVSPGAVEGLRILVADDNQTNRRILDAMLSGLGARITLVEDGHQACAAYRPGAFDGMMLDISMPGLDGLETLARIRGIETAAGLPHIPAVAVTANAMQHQIDAYRTAGFDAHVAKPFRKEALAHALDLIARQSAEA